ncbi:MAG TPA: hypothetical protein VGR70_22490 [Stellaceae bacterium]|nr:hypothetical protein [Stellaceae bacterium]
MAAIEDIVAWCRAERSRLAHQLEALQSGRLRTCEKQAQPPGWLEIDTTAQSIDRCREYISELNAIIARHPEIAPAATAAAAAPARPVPATAPQERRELQRDAIHPDWAHGWGVVKGTQPNWDCMGAYATRSEAEDEAAKAGKGYYVRWGSYNERTKEFTSGPLFSTL